MNKPITTRQVLDADTPPEDDQGITYYVAERVEDGGIIHCGGCTKLHVGRGTALLEETGASLGTSLKTSGAKAVCAHCHGDQWKLLHALLQRNQPSWGDGGDAWVDSTLLLLYEAFKPQNVEAWCRWSTKRTVEQIVTRTREQVKWGEKQGNGYMMVFEAEGGNQRSVVLSAGDHICVQRTNGFGRVMRVHGLIPVDLSGREEQGQWAPGVLVPVGAGFKRTHMELAVQLFEQSVDRGRKPLDKVAENAVRTAELVLA